MARPWSYSLCAVSSPAPSEGTGKSWIVRTRISASKLLGDDAIATLCVNCVLISILVQFYFSYPCFSPVRRGFF